MDDVDVADAKKEIGASRSDKGRNRKNTLSQTARAD